MSGGFAATGRVSAEAAIGLLRRMLEIPSSSCEESELASYLAEAMTGLGFDAFVDQAGNAVGRIDRGPGPHVMLLGHLDTVPGQIPVRRAAGNLYGRGASDAKGPLAAMICAAANAAAFTGKISVIGAVEEEVPSARGAVAVRDSQQPPAACIIGEPSGWSAVVIGYKGKLDLRYAVECPSAHPTSPAPKATELATDCWVALKDILGPTDHTVFARPGLTLESLSGDTATAVARIGVRIPPGLDTGALLAELRSRLTAGTLSVLGARSPCLADHRNPAVRALVAGIRRRSGQPRLLVKTATSDMNTLAEKWDVPMASYGPGESKLDHTDEEHIAIDDYFLAITVLSDALTQLSQTL
jgi:LysW-gamma-L-lysine carboxypeptidase